MSIVITPGPAHLRREPTPAGRLAASLLSVTVAGLADPQRFRRGKAIPRRQRRHPRSSCRKACCWQRSSAAAPSRTTSPSPSRPSPVPKTSVRCPNAAHVARLIPRGEELLFSCTCPDWDDPCKHGVAALLALAAELGTATGAAGQLALRRCRRPRRAPRSVRELAPIAISGSCRRAPTVAVRDAGMARVRRRRTARSRTATCRPKR